MIISIIKQIAVFSVFILIGLLLKKSKVLPGNSNDVISKLETKLFLPVYVFYGLAESVTLKNIKDYSFTTLYGLIFLIVAFGVGFVFSLLFAKKGRLRNIYIYLFTVTNFGYFGFPFIEGVFGQQLKADMIMFCIPLKIFTYTVGLYLLCGKKESGKKTKIDPIIVGLILGIVFGLLPIKLPHIIETVLSKLSDCMSPLAMILLGLTIGASPILKLFSGIKAYIVSAIRLIIIPVIVGAICWLFGARGNNLLFSVFVAAMPIGLNVVVFLQDDSGDAYLGARYCFTSVLFSTVTIPVLYYLMTRIGVML
ncbi:MAG: AEC family transporter [Clostridia bacterium]|nr:AEC family transporter [Clostridia bacterium]